MQNTDCVISQQPNLVEPILVIRRLWLSIPMDNHDLKGPLHNSTSSLKRLRRWTLTHTLMLTLSPTLALTPSPSALPSDSR